MLRQDNLPDYGIPSAAWQDSLLTPTTVHATRPVDQSNYYGSPHVDYDHADQNTLLARVEHNITPRWLVTNQTRYNKTEREAVISSIGGVRRRRPRRWRSPGRATRVRTRSPRTRPPCRAA